MKHIDSSERLFFALWPDQNTRNSIQAIMQLPEVANSGKLVRIDNLHITLEFLGQVSGKDKEELIQSIDKLQHEPFELELNRMGWWPKPQILWIGTTQIPRELIQLVKSIRNCVKKQGLKSEKREYIPHVTIARKVKQKISAKDGIKVKWNADSFVLVASTTSSDGVKYDVIDKWFFTKKP